VIAGGLRALETREPGEAVTAPGRIWDFFDELSMSRIAEIQPGSTFLLPFDEAVVASPRRRRKRGPARQTSAASLDAYERIKESRQEIYPYILKAIAAHGPAPAECLTAREILRALIGNGVLPANAERNAISPRANELLKAGCLENPLNDDGRIYLKHVPGDAPASVWRITNRGQALLDYLLEQAKQKGAR
jgi:hypothetical protein